jgi:hypothetical protein
VGLRQKAEIAGEEKQAEREKRGRRNFGVKETNKQTMKITESREYIRFHLENMTRSTCQILCRLKMII